MTQKNRTPNYNISLKANNSGEEVPFITISNSNSSKNKNSKSSSNDFEIFLDQNSKTNRQIFSFNIIKKKLSPINNNQDKKSFETFTFTDNSLLNHKSLNMQEKQISNLSMSEDQKEIQAELKTDKKSDFETPKKKYDNNTEIFQRIEIKKAMKPIENINGKNLMDCFNNTYKKSNIEEKNEDRISSFKIISNPTFCLNKYIVNTKKSLNKINNKNNNKINNNFSSISKSIQKKSWNNFTISNQKKFQNIANSIDKSQRLLSKYIPKNIYNINDKNTIFRNIIFKNIINTKKIKNVEKMKKTPKSESYNKTIFNPYLRESASKNLFHNFKAKISNEINLNKNLRTNKKRLSAKIIRNKNSKYQLNNLYKMINKKNNIIKIKPFKKESIVNININKINNMNGHYSRSLKNKSEKELLKPNEKNEKSINRAYIFKSNGQKSKNKK